MKLPSMECGEIYNYKTSMSNVLHKGHLINKHQFLLIVHTWTTLYLTMSE